MSTAVPRVVELTSPFTRFAGRLLVGLGYEVVLVEPPEGDADRRELDGDAFAHWHAGKRSVTLDPATPEGAAGLRRLLAGADALLDGTADGVESLAEGLDHLVHVRVTPFGLVGPRSDWQGSDLVVAATGGMLAQVGDPDGPPLRMPENQAEHLAGVNAAIAVLLGLRARRQGPGQLIDVSAQACVAAALEAGVLAYLHEDRVPPRPGSVHPLVPHGLFRAADGHLGGGLGGSPRMWDALLAWLREEGAQADLAEPRWQDPVERKKYQDHVFKVVQDFVGLWPKAEFAEQAQARKLPWAAVDLPCELPGNPQLAARNFFTRVADRTDLGFPFAFPEGHRVTELTVAGPGDDQALLDERRSVPVGRIEGAAPGRPAQGSFLAWARCANSAFGHLPTKSCTTLKTCSWCLLRSTGSCHLGSVRSACAPSSHSQSSSASHIRGLPPSPPPRWPSAARNSPCGTSGCTRPGRGGTRSSCR